MKRHCTFCGLNGGGMKFRSKSPDRVIAELALLSEKYGITRFEAVDNILDFSYHDTLLPRLAADPSHRYSIFFETKSNLRENHVALLAAAGVEYIQPGIESFHDGALRLLDKGNNAAQNVALLKFAQEYGVEVNYNILYGIPGEDEAWYVDMAKWLPRIAHLEPPRAIGRIRYDRFSPFHSDPERFGIHLDPNRAYGHIYPLAPEDLVELAYFFEDYGDTQRGYYGRAAYANLWKVWLEWKSTFSTTAATARGRCSWPSKTKTRPPCWTSGRARPARSSSFMGFCTWSTGSAVGRSRRRRSTAASRVNRRRRSTTPAPR